MKVYIIIKNWHVKKITGEPTVPREPNHNELARTQAKKASQ